MTSHALLAAGRLSRALHRRGWLGGRSSGAVRLLARALASQGRVTYSDAFGHETEADLSDYMERSGFLGAHSPELIRYVASRLHPGDWAVDVGANVGIVASAMCAAVGPSGAVWAVEPLPRNVERLLALRERNRLEQLLVLDLALSSSSSSAHLRLPATPGGSGFGSFVASWASTASVEVPTRALDELVAEKVPSQPLRLIKIDVEGHEAAVLEGAENTLRRHRPLVLCEFHDQLLREAGSSARHLLARFDALGYRPRPPFDLPRTLDGCVADILLVPT